MAPLITEPACLMKTPDILAAESSGGFVRWLGETVGGFLAGIPPAMVDFFGGVAAGAGLHSWVDWAAMLIGLSMLLSAAASLRRGRIVGPVISGAIGVGLMGWAIA